MISSAPGNKPKTSMTIKALQEIYIVVSTVPADGLTPEGARRPKC